MFLAVWVLYAADRLLDARSLDVPAPASRTALGNHGHYPPEIEERHLFHHRHRRVFRYVIAGASLALSLLVPEFPPDSLHLYLILSGILFGYFILIHVNGDASVSSQHDRVPKELAVGIFFTAATFIPTVARLPGLRLALLPQALLLTPLLIVNCLFIYAWEHSGSSARTHPATRIAVRFLPTLAAIGVFANLAIATLTLSLSSHSSGHFMPWQLPLACAIAFLLLLICHCRRHRFARTTLRSVADLCLLTPILIIPLLH